MTRVIHLFTLIFILNLNAVLGQNAKISPVKNSIGSS